MAVTVHTTEYESTLRELARAIRRRRSECIPEEVARQLLEYDRPGHSHLVGLDAPADHAVLYHCEGEYAVAVEFGPGGLADGGYEIASFTHGPSVEWWVATTYPEWGWLHPRYR